MDMDPCCTFQAEAKFRSGPGSAASTSASSPPQSPICSPPLSPRSPKRLGLTVDITTTFEEANIRKMLHNTQVLYDNAPRTEAVLSKYQAKWTASVETTDEYPEPLEKEALVGAALSIPLRPRPEFEEFRDQFFNRKGAYCIR